MARIAINRIAIHRIADPRGGAVPHRGPRQEVPIIDLYVMHTYVIILNL